MHESARFFVEYQQLAQRLRLDIPTLSDPVVRDCLHESDLFVRSFNGMGAFGLLSPFDCIQIVALASELVSHLLVLLSLTGGSANVGVLLLSLLSALFPLLLGRFAGMQSSPEVGCTPDEARTAEREGRLRNLAYSEVHRPEVLLFGLGPWVLQSWTSARKALLYDGQRASVPAMTLGEVVRQINVSDLVFAVQNVSVQLGRRAWLTVCRCRCWSCCRRRRRRSGRSRCTAARCRRSCSRLGICSRPRAWPSRASFSWAPSAPRCTSTPSSSPSRKTSSHIRPCPTASRSKPGLLFSIRQSPCSLRHRHLAYTYPGSTDASLHDVTFTLLPGESLAIVGYNGSGKSRPSPRVPAHPAPPRPGKSTLAKVLLRILDFDAGDLLVNGVDIRRLAPADYHRHVSAVFQDFSKFNASLRENVGLGYVPKLHSLPAVSRAVHLGGADTLLDTLPHGLKTKLDCSDALPPAYPGTPVSARQHHGLSGGEVRPDVLTHHNNH